MSGFIIKCNNCGNSIITGDDYKANNNVISIQTTVENYCSINEYLKIILWCEECENNTEFI